MFFLFIIDFPFQVLWCFLVDADQQIKFIFYNSSSTYITVCIKFDFFCGSLSVDVNTRSKWGSLSKKKKENTQTYHKYKNSKLRPVGLWLHLLG